MAFGETGRQEDKEKDPSPGGFKDPEDCSCGNCPDMPTDVEKKCCLGRVAGRGLWRNRYSTTGEESLTF